MNGTLRWQREVERFDATLEVERAWTPPASWYTDAELFCRERETVFARHWFVACRAAEVERNGQFVAGEHLGQPWFVQRGADGVLRAFHNACRHHATRLLEGRGACEAIVCPYHGWTYDQGGALRSAPKMGGVRAFDRGEFGLRGIRVETWLHWAFLCFDDDAPSLDVSLGALAARFEEARALRFAAERRYEVACNWKVFVDNYLDGGYHVPLLHPVLAAGLEEPSYATELVGAGVLQRCASKDGGESLFGWFHPAFMLNRYGGVLDANLVRPLGPERTEVLFEWYCEEGADVEAVVAASDRVQHEDMEISASVQAGLRSPSYDRGRYAPRLEHGMHAFHRMLAADLLVSARRGGGPRSGPSR